MTSWDYSIYTEICFNNKLNIEHYMEGAIR